MARFIAATTIHGRLQAPGLPEGGPWTRHRLHVATEGDVDLVLSIGTADCKITTINALDVALLDSVSPPHQPVLVLWVHESLIDALRERWERSSVAGARQAVVLAPWTAVFPGLVITLCIVAFNVAGDGVRDALDPRRGRWPR